MRPEGLGGLFVYLGLGWQARLPKNKDLAKLQPLTEDFHASENLSRLSGKKISTRVGGRKFHLGRSFLPRDGIEPCDSVKEEVPSTFVPCTVNESLARHLTSKQI